jgi:hypothetical protein
MSTVLGHVPGSRRRHSPVLAASVLFVAIAAVSGCGGHSKKPTPDASASASTDDASTRSAILAAYDGWSRASDEAAQASNPNSPELAKWGTEPLLSQTRSGLQELHDEGIALHGSSTWTVRITSLSLDVLTPSAVLDACLDTTRIEAVNKATGEPVPASTQLLKKYKVIAAAKKVGGRWLITRDDPQPSTPCS